MANRLIDKMKTGDKTAVVAGLSHPGAIYRMNAISFSVLFHISDAEIIQKITELKNDQVALDGYSVSDFAFAALDVMGFESYVGNKASVKNLIKSKFEFLK